MSADSVTRIAFVPQALEARPTNVVKFPNPFQRLPVDKDGPHVVLVNQPSSLGLIVACAFHRLYWDDEGADQTLLGYAVGVDEDGITRDLTFRAIIFGTETSYHVSSENSPDWKDAHGEVPQPSAFSLSVSQEERSLLEMAVAAVDARVLRQRDRTSLTARLRPSERIDLHAQPETQTEHFYSEDIEAIDLATIASNWPLAYRWAFDAR